MFIFGSLTKCMEKIIKENNIEKYSSAFTLSDMEIFIYPELLQALVLANIMSPIIWEWKKDPWFCDIENKSFNYKLNRVKQYIMERTVFNLDLDTWGLTTKETEINRFKNIIDTDILAQSNALFGYEGDKYYFDIDIRKHFGLDKYSNNIIPYWKTETIEAMMAFRFKPNYNIAAGECVSFSALYAAALFILAKIPLEDIFLISTPLHSQNFICQNEGVFTNNRRIVTKKMWFNGTELSQKARRAIENEKITIVSNLSGYIHCMYHDATINKAKYEYFEQQLTNFLKLDFSTEVFLNFIRCHSQYQYMFQYHVKRKQTNLYICLKDIFMRETNSKNSFSNESRNALLNEMPNHLFSSYPLEDKVLFNDFEKYIEENRIITTCKAKEYLLNNCSATSSKKYIDSMFEEIKTFISTTPHLPDKSKTYIPTTPIDISPDMTQNDIIQYLKSIREESEVAELSFYVYRDMNTIDWHPFLKAAWQRNPVSVKGMQNLSVYERYEIINNMNNVSIYDGNRISQPDEAWNFGTGDGIEKAILLANTLINIDNDTDFVIETHNKKVILTSQSYGAFIFYTTKDLKIKATTCK